MSDEDGHVSLFNSNHKFASSATHQENTGLISLLPVCDPIFFFLGFNSILSRVLFQMESCVQITLGFVTGLLITMRSSTFLGSRFAICSSLNYVLYV